MSGKKPLVLLLFCFVSLALSAQQTSYGLSEGSVFSVIGTSTMHDWTATSSDITHEINLSSSLSDLKAGMEIGAVKLDIPVASLDGGRGNIMNDKIKKALKAPTHPTVSYTMTKGTIEGVSAEETGVFNLQTTGMLSIGGVEKEVSIPVKGKLLDNSSFSFEGSYTTKMTEFEVEPPSALFGQIQTDDEIVITFSLTLYPEN